MTRVQEDEEHPAFIGLKILFEKDQDMAEEYCADESFLEDQNLYLLNKLLLNYVKEYQISRSDIILSRINDLLMKYSGN